MKNSIRVMTGIGVGVGAMYFLDRDRGRRRRAVARDKVFHRVRRTGSGVNVTARDVAHRVRGVVAKTRRLFARWPVPMSVSDEVLVARIRSRLGRLVSHPHAVEVKADRGSIILRGLVLDREVSGLISSLHRIQGVHSIDNQLKVYREEDHVPALQGGGFRQGEAFELLRENWSPAARLAVGAAAIAPVALSFPLGFREGPVRFFRFPLLGIGAGLILRAATNRGLKALLGMGEAGMITTHKTIRIDAPSENVFNFLGDLQNLGKFLPDVLEIRALGQNRTRWSIVGPAGVPIRWTAVTTRFEPSRLVAWQSEPGSVVRHRGRIRIDTNPDQSTKVELELSYNPPLGALGHAIIRAFGSDPKSRLDDNLLRVKSLIERGAGQRIARWA